MPLRDRPLAEEPRPARSLTCPSALTTRGSPQLVGIQHEIEQASAGSAALAAASAPSAVPPAPSPGDSPSSGLQQRSLIDPDERMGSGFAGDPSTSDSPGCFFSLRGLMSANKKNERNIREAIKGAQAEAGRAMDGCSTTA